VAHALVVGSSSLLSSRGIQLATLATYHRLPPIYFERGRQGADIFDAVRQCGVYVGRILKGQKPGACPLPRRSSSSSSSTSGGRGRWASPCRRTLLALADEVIE
jgi:putative ABC transport system substrate-binding protein